MRSTVERSNAWCAISLMYAKPMFSLRLFFCFVCVFCSWKVDDTKIVSGSYDMTLKVWDLKSGECRNTLHGHTAAVICLQYDEERIVSGSADNTIKVSVAVGPCVHMLC